MKRTHKLRHVATAGAAATVLLLAGQAFAAPIPLTLTNVTGNTLGPQSTSNPCVIAGTNCQNPAGFGYNNFTQSGNISSYNMYSTTPTANVADGVAGTPYTVGQINGVTNNSPFQIAIDVNTSSAAGETLQLFEVLLNGVAAYSYVGPTAIGNITNNGNGYGDWTLGTIDLSSYAANTGVLFHAVWNNASAGAESFFIVASPRTASVPEPGTLGLLGIGLVGVAMAVRRRKGAA